MNRKHRKQRRQTKKKNQYKERAAHENEEFKDTFMINESLRTSNFGLLREIGRKKGFMSHAIRRRVWPFLLHSADQDTKRLREGSLDVPHKDESQVMLDTPRSFNSYPKNVSAEDKLKLQGQLERVIVHVLRSYPSLHYYQGFHDICAVILLLFGEVYACQLMNTLAVFYLRDAMSSTFEPILKELTIMDTLIKLEDKELHEFITEANVLPYYSISWVITWCSHDLDDLDKLARLFDFFIVSNPFMVVYFSAAVVLSRKSDILKLPCDNSIIHSFLTKLPKDLDVDKLIEKAYQLEQSYSVFEIQCESSVALGEYSAINRFDQEFLPIQSIEDLNDKLGIVIPLLKEDPAETPIKLTTEVTSKKPNTMLERLLLLYKKDTTLFTLFTVSAGVGLLAVMLSNMDVVR
ncbi:rab-GTPase-TBC domain-containing protein [Pilobolus umbonatus]|nr:rab-GTPase-TBC domain-containing protein [Pilobolus umbonatus]